MHLIVNVGPQDFGTDPLAGMEFQRYYEKLAFKAGGSCYNAAGTECCKLFEIFAA